MCLAIPMKLLELNGEHGTVEYGGARKEIMLTLIPQAAIGDYVIVHAGYALEVLDEGEALRTIELIRLMGDMDS